MLAGLVVMNDQCLDGGEAYIFERQILFFMKNELFDEFITVI